MTSTEEASTSANEKQKYLPVANRRGRYSECLSRVRKRVQRDTRVEEEP